MNNVSIHRQLRSAPVRDSSDKPAIGRDSSDKPAAGSRDSSDKPAIGRQDFVEKAGGRQAGLHRISRRQAVGTTAVFRNVADFSNMFELGSLFSAQAGKEKRQHFLGVLADGIIPS